MVLEISTVCRFFHITVKEFLHKCQPGVGRWLKMGNNWSMYFLNDPKCHEEDINILFVSFPAVFLYVSMQ